MIPINDYRQFVAELVAKASELSDVEVGKIRLAVTEKQLVNLLKDQPGVIVAGNVPGMDLSYSASFWLSEGDCLIEVLERMSDDYQGTSREFDEYARLQRLMQQIVRLLIGEDFQEFCDKGEVDFSRPLTVEWEYNIHGGFNGLSLAFRLKDRQI